MLDEGLVEAEQTLRTLEDGEEEDFYPIIASRRLDDDDQDGSDGGRPSKRIRNGSNGVGDGDGEDEQEKVDRGPAGLLGHDALDNIRFYADMARKQAEEDRKRKVPTKAAAVKAPPKKTGMALLGGYSSGDDSS